MLSRSRCLEHRSRPPIYAVIIGLASACNRSSADAAPPIDAADRVAIYNDSTDAHPETSVGFGHDLAEFVAGARTRRRRCRQSRPSNRLDPA
jgi:hypothetical protein